MEDGKYEVRVPDEGTGVLNWKITLGGSFMIMAVFWAGAMYNRMGNMESAIADIRQSLAPLSEVALLKLRVTTLEGSLEQMRRQKERESIIAPR